MPNLPTDRELVVALAEQVMGWNRQSRDHGWMTVEDREGCISANSDWNPLTSPLDALELEGMVPEEKRKRYESALWNILDQGVKLNPGTWELRRAIPRQIAEAVWLTCCGKEEK